MMLTAKYPKYANKTKNQWRSPNDEMDGPAHFFVIRRLDGYGGQVGPLDIDWSLEFRH
jgi:hypothetical protein